MFHRIVLVHYHREYIMAETRRLVSVFLAAIFTTIYSVCIFAVESPGSAPDVNPPAGQVCPRGSFVIGFDNDSNILCSGICGNHVLDSGETCDDGNLRDGDGCSATCQSESPAGIPPVEDDVVEEPSEPTAGEPLPPVNPVISKIKPWKVVWGKREVEITIFGMGFTSESSVQFNGVTYKPTVNQAGTELKVTLATRQLPIGQYAIKVSNGPGLETTMKKGLAIF